MDNLYKKTAEKSLQKKTYSKNVNINVMRAKWVDGAQLSFDIRRGAPREVGNLWCRLYCIPVDMSVRLPPVRHLSTLIARKCLIPEVSSKTLRVFST